jgi:hypothetical protein
MNQRRSTRDRVLGLAWLALAVGVAVLLIAGYGLPVGLGALGGVLLGFVAGAVGALWLGRGSGRSITFGGQEWSSMSASTVLTAELEDLSEIGSADLGDVRAVVPVLMAREASGLVVTVVAVELREGGVILSFDVQVRPGTIRPGWLARVLLADDVGTSYRAIAQGQGGSPTTTRYVATALPAPPSAATRLDVRIERFSDVEPGRDRTKDGPWTFTVPLRSGATSLPSEA